ncbi:UDP-N-acetylglucosamine 1-carboxyvinyltransferase [Persephonella hydrogeniphila]|uniref:UDP-N-acetylglucosamine 1-carboxyvinyltransferase n=1 Tax=Persephonella hydrogeniphila TaxID=198703 RepID=A0A285NPH0_9AQUI|nr:UDP-N-acetylglucosamine 1-carboxyvinyltransferase [Persephonella hydrogeniphila]SNZ09531.1 UDP-N-acetylglucosamine 1-carboxyvinyltransferase [Persephonella hydrogeniphila]
MINIEEGVIEYLEIEGQRELKGSVKISGAKNAALPDMAATILTDETVILENIPYLLDVSTMKDLLEHIGVQIEEKENSVFSFSLKEVKSLQAPYELVSKMRASILVLGPLLTRFGYAKVALPGGCSIGTRPVDLHLKALQKMGARIKVEHGYIYAEAPYGLKGSYIYFDKKSVTGTENIMMAATLAEGQTVIDNAAREPEVVDLANMLKKMGADIKGEGTDRIIITGVKKLKGTKHRIIPDRIEAGTFAVIAALFEGNIVIEEYPSEYLGYVHTILRDMGINVIKLSENQVIIKKSGRLKPVNIQTKEYPYFPTDLQAQFMTLLSVVEGRSKITENIFENRFMHVPELKRLGADITVNGRDAFIKGVKKLSGAQVKATDLRASAAMVIAGLIADGKTRIYNIYHLDRGYENLDSKLRLLGASVKRGFEDISS